MSKYTFNTMTGQVERKDEPAAGDVTEMTPEKLREFIENGCSARPEDKHDALVGVSAWEADRTEAEWKRAFDKGEVAGMHSDSAETDNPFPEGSNEYCGWSFGFCAERDRRAHKRLEGAESRVEALEKDAQRYRWLRGDGSKPTAYRPEEEGIWGGEELDAFCDAALAAEPKLKLVDLGGGLSSYENLGRNPPEERAALAKEEKKP